MTLARTGLTLEEFLALPEEKPALEYIDGVVVQKMAPRPEHGALQAEILVHLHEQLRPGPLGVVWPELRVVLGGQARVPDLAVYRRARVPRDANGHFVEEARTPPDLAIEIRSLGQTLAEQTRACEWYVANGVTLAVLVDGRSETMQLFHAGAPPRTYDRRARIDLRAAVPGLQLDVNAVFAALDAEPPELDAEPPDAG
jgi:Uma2 family endonuclease